VGNMEVMVGKKLGIKKTNGQRSTAKKD
jgi:hypothetical protein